MPFRALPSSGPIRTGSNDSEYIAELERELAMVLRSLKHALQRVDQAERKAAYLTEHYVPRRAR